AAHDRTYRGEETERGGDHARFRSNASGCQGQPTGVSSRRTANARIHSQVACRLAFEALKFRASDEVLGSQHTFDGCVDVILDGLVLTSEVKHGNRTALGRGTRTN